MAVSSDPDRDAALALLAASCDDDLDAIYEATPSGARGTVLACSYERKVPVEEMRAIYAVGGHADPGLSSAAFKLRIAYVTERLAGETVVTSGSLYIPETRRGDPSPLLVTGHGSVGSADRCAPSREDPDGFDKDWKNLVYTFAGDGWIVLQPDFPGLGTQGSTTWMHAPDEGHAILDATRAARRLFADGVLSDRNALIGHSNGGHAVLAAQAYADDYGAQGSIDSVVALNPFWLSNGAWGALLSSFGNTLVDSTFLALTLMYFVGHLDAYEGPEARLDAFLPETAEAVDSLLDSGCWQVVTDEETGPPSIDGAKFGSDLYAQAYTDDVGLCGLNGTCDSALAQTWLQRWVADRPPLTASTPIVHITGEMDGFVPPGFQQCGLDRILAQGAPIDVCVQPGSNHSGVIPDSADWLRRHLAHVLLDEPAPESCAGQEVFDEPPVCSLPIPNGLDPSEP
jgi:Secretory lipase